MMFNLFRSLKTEGGWLGNDECLFTLKLCNVADPFDPYPLWEHRFSGVKEITESITGSTGTRLRDALEVHRCIMREKDESGRLVRIPRVFGDVVVWVSDSQWKRDIRTGSNKMEVLADNLSHMHREDFGKELCISQSPSYVIMPDFYLNDDEVVFQFGLGVFIPRKEDHPVGEMHLQLKGETPWKPLPAWTFWENGIPVYRPAGLYSKQTFLLIGPSHESSATRPPLMEDASPLWFSHSKGRLIVNLASRFAFGDGEFLSDGEIVSQDQDNSTVWLFNDLNPDTQDAEEKEELLLKITMFEKEVSQAPADHYGKETGGSTIVPGADISPSGVRGVFTLVPGQTEDALVLEGFAFLRIDTRAGGVPGLRSWTLWIDETGQPVTAPFAEGADEEGLMAFSATSGQDFLSFREPGKKYFEKVKHFPFSLPHHEGQSLEILPSPIPDKYHGILKLPDLAMYPLEEAPLVLGRSDAKSDASRPDIQLQFLSHPASLKWQKGKERPEAYLGAIGLSRRHVQVNIQDGQLRVIMKEGSVPVYGLDRNAQLKQILGAAASGGMILDTGEYLLIGCYLMRFEPV
ncbi:hypothetical protein QUF80_21745 [Desulfococcaceae bacterium HSG8]|nr:hypothetical protein [Desulfococcaceae bacterium HSG8]